MSDRANDAFDEEFKPRGTIAIVAMFVATLILLWLSIYLILIARGVTV
ncbi:MAG: cytochrome c oxidase subunit 2A [Acidimicrobiia bacterium]|nr:cytochrome c oxidase subunit 2A [Acidimicrobiia bacterium]